MPDGNKIIKDKKIKIEKGPIQPLEHLNCFNTRSLCLLMKKHDFRKIKINELIFYIWSVENWSLPKLRFMVSDLRNNIFSTTIKLLKYNLIIYFVVISVLIFLLKISSYLIFSFLKISADNLLYFFISKGDFLFNIFDKYFGCDQTTFLLLIII